MNPYRRSIFSCGNSSSSKFNGLVSTPEQEFKYEQEKPTDEQSFTQPYLSFDKDKHPYDLPTKSLPKSQFDIDYVNTRNDILKGQTQEEQAETISKNISFNAYVIKLFRQRMAATSQESAEALSIGDILFLKEKKILPLGANWGFLDVVGTLYDADPNYQSEEFLQIRNKIVLEHNDIIKKIYLSALTEKREMLLRDNIKKEITYNVALLEEQIRQDLKGTERSVLESVTMAVWRTRIEKE